jgi:2'-5' RNA ligase
LKFNRVRFGPTLRHPRLLWVDCEPNSELSETLMTAYGQLDPRPFVPHVTLARLPRNGRAIVWRHPIDQALSLTERITSVELFQSPRKGERGYQILASAPLKKEPTFAAQTS